HRLEGGKRHCSDVDLNFDGKPDLVRFYDADGTTVSFEQHDYDFDGKVDDNDNFKLGKMERKELDTNFDGLLDTWMWCQGPLVQKAERARRKPGRIDTWESYQNGVLAEVQYDENNDGKVEKWDMYRQGSLFETRVDTNEDGKPDRTDPAESDSDAQDARVSCDGTTLPPLAPAAPAATAAASATADAGVPAKPSTAAVFGVPSNAPGATIVTRDAGVAAPIVTLKGDAGR
ncbi:MAG: putative lipoprotein, partial [Myxococcaceae bacterium]|nr:putative lipoprotein [Myxococcaceae bacterium]